MRNSTLENVTMVRIADREMHYTDNSSVVRLYLEQRQQMGEEERAIILKAIALMMTPVISLKLPTTDESTPAEPPAA